jgi:hypothetical protein
MGGERSEAKGERDRDSRGKRGKGEKGWKLKPDLPSVILFRSPEAETSRGNGRDYF